MCNSEIKHSDWLLQVMWLVLTNQSALFFGNVAMLLLYSLWHHHHNKTNRLQSALYIQEENVAQTVWDMRFSQCDEMARLFVNIWSRTPMKNCEIASKICQSTFKLMPIAKWRFRIDSKVLQTAAKRQIFAKSGHTGPNWKFVVFALSK